MDQLQHIASVVHTITIDLEENTTNTDITFPSDEPFSDDKINYFIHSTNQVMINKITIKGKLARRKLQQGDKIKWK